MSGIKRIFASSKGLAAIAGLLGVYFIQVAGMDEITANTLTVSVVTLSGLYIAGTAYEDGKK